MSPFKFFKKIGEWDVWLNDIYKVMVRKNETNTLVHLNISRIDKQPSHDWNHFQQIKSEIVGPECEGFEVYPAESRLIDTVNQYHLWVFNDMQYRIPVGMMGKRRISEGNHG